jgi:hypothetical protein
MKVIEELRNYSRLIEIFKKLNLGKVLIKDIIYEEQLVKYG